MEAAGRGAVRVNQVGYLRRGPKRATLVTSRVAAVPFEVRNGAGEIVFRGLSERAGGAPEPTSGLPLHVLDFSALDATGDGFTVVADEASHPFELGGTGYERLRRDALAFFYAMRSGIEIRDDVLPGYGRPAGHAGVPPNRGDTAVGAWEGPEAERLYEGWRCDLRLDVSGGWYDAGDHGKYVVSGAVAAALLMSTYERALHAPTGRTDPLADGALAIPEHGDGVPDVLDEVRWELEWLLRMQVPAEDPLAGLAFHKVHDDHWTPLALAPDRDPARRVLHRPSTAAALDLAAAAAQGSRLFRPYDPPLAVRLLAAARLAHAAARRHSALYAPFEAGAFGGGPYDDSDLRDDWYWASVELYLTTGEPEFLRSLLASPCHRDGAFDLDGFDWRHVAALARLDLALVPSELDRAPLRRAVLDAADRLLALQSRQPWDQPYAPADNRWVWGSNGRILSNVIVLGAAFDAGGQIRHRDGALRGLDYVLGRNAAGISYVTGHGTVFARHQRIRHFAHDLDPALPPPPPGTLAGGPTSIRYGYPEEERFTGLPPQLCYVDDVRSETTNDAAINWNAALVRAASFAADQAAANG
jgi:endoglucanase